MNHRISFLVLLVLLLLSGHLVAQESIAALRRAAEQGDSTAQNDLGMRYALGAGMPRDDQEAVKWFRKAAEQGDAEAQYNMGLMYARGQGVSQNDQEAMWWSRKAADQGYAKAQSLLGVMYEQLQGDPQAHQEAVKWYHRGAAQGEPISQLKLGLLMEQGQGVPRDGVQALVWLYLAQSHGNADAKSHIDRIVKQLDTHQIAEVQEKVRHWKSTDSYSPAREMPTPDSSSSQVAAATPDTAIIQTTIPPDKAEPDMVEVLISTSIFPAHLDEISTLPAAAGPRVEDSPPVVAVQATEKPLHMAIKPFTNARMQAAPIAGEMASAVGGEPGVPGEVSQLLGEATLYLQQARHPKSGPPPEGQEALRKLRQAERLDPKNSSVARALRLYARRHLACTGLFASKETADKEISLIQALGIPAFQQPMRVQEKPMLRTCIGLFATQEELEKNLHHMRTALGNKEAILRVYEDADFPILSGN
ncbi:MAG: sel1 repeat family protein [Magnetococcus sp. DMHC-8]